MNGPTFDVYQRDNGSWVVHVDTANLPENACGPLITIYVNDDTENPAYDNREAE